MLNTVHAQASVPAQASAQCAPEQVQATFALPTPAQVRVWGHADNYPENAHTAQRAPVALDAEASRWSMPMLVQLQGVQASGWSVPALHAGAQALFAQGQFEDGWTLAEYASQCGYTPALELLVEQSVRHGHRERALRVLEQAVQAQMPQAMYLLAEQYERGQLGLPKDGARAFQWYFKAAQAGYPKAMTAVAYQFITGSLGVQDELAAAHWYHQAARAGDVQSMTAYGWLMLNAKTLPRDAEEGRWYIRKAAELRDPAAERMWQELQRQPRSTAQR